MQGFDSTMHCGNNMWQCNVFITVLNLASRDLNVCSCELWASHAM